MKKFLAFFISNYKLSFLLATLLLVAGLASFSMIRREARPPVDFARATITTAYPGSSPEEVEEKITIKIEDELRGIEGIKDVKSVSQSGLSTINVRVDMDRYDTKEVIDELQRAVQRVQGLPLDIPEPPQFKHANAKEIPIIEMALIGSNENRLRDRLVNNFKSILEDDPAVAEVVLSGYREREFQILLDPTRLERHHVGMSEVVEAVRRRTQNIPAGYIRAPGDQRLVRVTGQIREADQMKDIVVRSNFSGQRITIGDIAKVKDGAADSTVSVRVNGDPATLITLTKKADADTIRANQRLINTINEFKSKLPEGYQIISYRNEATFIADRLNIVVNNALAGLALVFIVMMIFLPGSLGVVASLSLPLALFGTLAIMGSYDITFNTITMLAFVIAIGMLVDNSVVISENYARLRLNGLNRSGAALQAVHQFWLPLSATVATTVVAFLPMLVTKGVMGQFIKWIPIVVTTALVFSLIESFILLPGRLQFTILNLDKFRNKGSQQSSTWFDKFQVKFETFMNLALRFRYMVFAAISATLIGSIILAVKGNRFELFPTEDVEYYFSEFEAPKKTVLDRMDELAGQLSAQVLEAIGPDNVKYIVARAGVSRIGWNSDSKNGDHVGMMTIAIPPDVAKQLDVQETLKKLRSIPKGEFTKLSFEANRGGPPVGKPLDVTFRSKNYEELKGTIEAFKSEVSKISGVVDLEDNEIIGGPEYKITPRHEVLARLNLDTQTVGAALRTALQGNVASELNLDGDEIDLRIRYDDSQRATFSSLQNTEIMEPGGRLIPLLSVVELQEQSGPAVRKHYNFKRSIAVTAEVVPSEITSVALNQKAQNIFEKMHTNYPSVSATFGGEQESTQESTSSLRNAMIIALFGIFAILVFLFRSFLVSFLVLSSIPLGLVGVSWAFFLHQRPLSFMALIGVVGLAGVVVNSAIVLVSYIEELVKEEKLPLTSILAKASSHRLRSVTVTTLTTVGGLMPTAYGLGGYDHMLVPLTLALAWGLVSGTVLTLVWVPCGYAIIEDWSRLLRQIFRRLAGKHYVTQEGSHENLELNLNV